MKHSIFELAENGRNDELKQMIKEGVDINQKDDFGYTPLHIAIVNGHEDTALLLLENGADGAVQDKNGFTPLHYAAEYNMYNVAKRILEKQPKSIDVENKYGNQPLWTATHNATIVNNAGKYDSMLQLFLKHGADIHHKNKANMSPIEIVSDPELLKYEGYRKLYDILMAKQ